MTVRILVSINRSSGVDQGVENVELAKKFLGNYVVGVELSGNPEDMTFKDYIPVLEKARELGIKISVHTAELDESRDETDEIIEF